MRGADQRSVTRISCSRCGFAAEPHQAPNFCPRCGEGLGSPPPRRDTEPDGTAIWTGQVIADRYRLLELLGQGGMGTVFKAEHIRMGKLLALKLLGGAFARDPAAVALFRAEAQIVSRLSHPHTIAVFDFGEIGEAGFYLAMEYVSGRDLSRLLHDHGPLGEARALGIAEQVLGSLAEAHGMGVVHRDVKPANVMLTEQRDEGDFVKLLDFGIAKLRAMPRFLPLEGAILGTPSYLAPEQALGAEVDGRADLYAVGALLYELVSGHPPFQGSPAQVRSAHVHLAPPPLVDLAPVSRGFAEVVHRALAKRAEERFPSAHAMRDALLALRGRLPGEEVSAWPEGPASFEEPVLEPGSLELASRDDFAAVDRGRRALRPGWLATAIVLVAALVAAVLAWRRGDLPPLLDRYAPSLAALLPAGARIEGEEWEPNDTAATSNVLALPAVGSPPPTAPFRGPGTMRGHIGAARDEVTGDADVFRIAVPPASRRLTLLAEWSAEASPDQGIPGLDVTLTLNRAPAAGDPHREAPFVAQAHRGPGRPLRLVALVGPGSYFLAVREVHPEGTRPVEKPDEAYLLRAWLQEVTPGEEVEPDDAPVMAEGVEAGYPDWREVGERNPLGEGTRIVGETAADDDDTYAVAPRAPSERPELVLLVPGNDELALSAELWMPSGDDLQPGARGTHFGDGIEGQPGEVVALRLQAPPTAGAPVLVRLRAAVGEGRYEILAVGSGEKTLPLLRARLEALAAAGRGSAALDLAAAFARALPRAPGRDELLLAAGGLAARLAPGLAPEGLAAYRAADKLLNRPIFEVVAGRVHYSATFELMVEGQGGAAEQARLLAVRAAGPCRTEETRERALAFLERFPRSRGAPEVRLALARAEEEIYFRHRIPAALRRALEAYRAVVDGGGPLSEEARRRIRRLSRRPLLAPLARAGCE